MQKIKKNKLINKWVLVFLSIILFLGTVTVGFISVGRSAPIDATNFGVDNISLDYSGEDAWTVSNKSISGSVTGDAGTMGCGADSKTSTLTITYDGENEGIIKFNYIVTLNNGSASINGTNITSNGNMEIPITPATNSFKITITSEKGAGTTKLSISDFELSLKRTITLTFKVVDNGTYSFNDEMIIEDTTFNLLGTDIFTLKAYPNEGYIFAGWSFDGVVYSDNETYTGTYSNNAVCYPIFFEEGYAVFGNNGRYFDYLGDAIVSCEDSSDNKIVLKKSGVLKTKLVNETFNINNGIILLIPNDERELIYIEDTLPIFYNGYSTPNVFRCLEIPNDVIINVNSGANLYVAAEAWAASGGANGGGSPTKSYGQIKLSGENSLINVKNGGEVYAFGYITGEGQVIAENGSKIHEFFQIGDFKGGTKTSGLVGRVFPFNQYFIQNIECLLTINYGAILNVSTGLYAGNELITTQFDFISTINDTSGLFKLHENTILKRIYDGENDTQNYILESGTADLSSITLKVYIDVDSAEYVVPITSNMRVKVLNDAIVNVNQDLFLMPGAQLNLDSNASLNITDGIEIYLFDRNSWIGKNFTLSTNNFVSVKYAVTKKYNRTNNDLLNAQFNLNGTLTIANNAGIFTTYSTTNNVVSYANIYSSKGTGKIRFTGNSVSSSSKISQYQWDGGIFGTGSVVSVNVVPIALRNSMDVSEHDNDTFYFLSNESSLVGTSFYFSINDICWKKDDGTINEFTINYRDSVYGMATYTEKYVNNENYTFPTAQESGFIYGEFQVRKWRIEGFGLFNPGETIQLSAGRQLEAYAVWGGWTSNGSDRYYVDYNTGDFLTGLNKVEHYDSSINEVHIFKFLDNGVFDFSYNGSYYNEEDENYYFISSGIVVDDQGFARYQNSNDIGTNLYDYLYVSTNNSLLTNGTYYVETNDNDILPCGYYTFDSNGYIVKEDSDTSHYNQEVYIANINEQGDATYIDGIRVSYGLLINNGHYYYSDSNGFIVKNKTYYVNKTNGLGINEGLYYFDELGRMYDESFNLIEVN